MVSSSSGGCQLPLRPARSSQWSVRTCAGARNKRGRAVQISARAFRGHAHQQWPLDIGTSAGLGNDVSGRELFGRELLRTSSPAPAVTGRPRGLFHGDRDNGEIWLRSPRTRRMNTGSVSLDGDASDGLVQRSANPCQLDGYPNTGSSQVAFPRVR